VYKGHARDTLKLVLAVSIAGKEDVLEVGDDGHTAQYFRHGRRFVFLYTFLFFPVQRVVVPV
jgi:hypothetical protein